MYEYMRSVTTAFSLDREPEGQNLCERERKRESIAQIGKFSHLRLPDPLKPFLPVLPKKLHTRRPIRRTIHRPRMQHHQPLKRAIPQIDRSPTLFAEVPIQRVPGLGRFVGVLLDQVFPLGEGELRLEEAVVMREGGAGAFLAVTAVAEDSAPVTARAGVLHLATEAGAGYGAGWAGFGHGCGCSADDARVCCRRGASALESEKR